MRYAHLMVAIPEELIWDGSQIEFWLSGQVMSAVYHWYSPTDYRYTSNIGDFPFLRRVNLEFPHPAILCARAGTLVRAGVDDRRLVLTERSEELVDRASRRGVSGGRGSPQHF